MYDQVVSSKSVIKAQFTDEVENRFLSEYAFGYVGLFNSTTVLRKGVSGFAEYIPFDFYGIAF